MKLFRLFEREQRPAAHFAEGRVGYAVGDIHGRADLLSDLLLLLERRAASERREGGDPIVIFLGDYVDRGPESARVIDMLLAGGPYGYERRFLKGNHEESMLAFLADPVANRVWLTRGGADTMLSYGVQPPSPMSTNEQEWLDAAAELAAKTPPAHLDFLNGLERYVELGGYAFVHAGVDDARPLDQQTDADLYWIRDRFISSKRRFSHRIVHGHTPVDEPYMDERRIAVDTGAYASGTLTAARFEEDRVDFVSVSARRPLVR